MKFVIYGAGYRGKKILESMGCENVVAFIEKDSSKIGKRMEDIPVIDLQQYINSYQEYYIIISPAYDTTIETMLVSKGIYQFSNSMNMPAEFQKYGDYSIKNGYDLFLSLQEKHFLLYGLNAFSILLQKIAKEKFGSDISIIPEMGCPVERICWAENSKDIHVENKEKTIGNEVYLVTTNYVNDEFVENKEKVNLFNYAVESGYYKNLGLEEVKNKYLGEKCFIVATGPSLRREDLKALHDSGMFCFSVNSIFKFAPEWSPTAYVCSDGFFVDSAIEEIKSLKAEFKFIGDGSYKFFEKGIENNVYKTHVFDGGYYKFSSDISQGIAGGRTVTNVCIQIAAYMGFKEIYLLGVDCNYQIGSRCNHAYEEEEDHRDHRTEEMIKFYGEAKKYADLHGIKIYNATRGGMLEVFERVDFDSLFK